MISKGMKMFNVHFDFRQCVAIIGCTSILFAYLFAHRIFDGAFAPSMLSIFVLCGTVFTLLILNMVLFSAEKKKIKHTAEKGNFDWGMHYFRAFAIVNIILVHAFQMLGHNRIANSLFLNSTIYFLFISGYLCQYLDLKKQTIPIVYYKKKIQNVISPYLVWTFLICIIVFISPINRCDVIALREGRFIRDLVLAVICGRAVGPYWYIPFVSILFIASPFILKLSGKSLVSLSAFSFLLFVIFPNRPMHFWYGPLFMFDLYTHFLFFYLIGFVYSRYREVIDCFLARYVIPLFAIGIMICISVLQPDWIELELFNLDGLISMQKLIFTGVILIVLKSLSKKRILIFDLIAKYSFTLFFTHQFLMSDCVRLSRFICAGIPYFGALLIECLIVSAYILFLVGLALIMKIATGLHSRSYIGA